MKGYVFIILFVCFGLFRPMKNFWLIKRRHQYLWRASNFDHYSALMVIRQWRFFNVPHVTYCDTGHSFLMVISNDQDTHTCCRAFVSGAFTACLNDLLVSDQISNLDLLHVKQTFYILSHHGCLEWYISNSHSLVHITALFIKKECKTIID